MKNNVVIIDEAHNLLDALAQMYASEVRYDQLHYGLLQLKNYKNKYSSRFSAFNLLCINQMIFVTSKLKMMLDKKQDETTQVFTVANFVLSAGIDNYNMFKLVKFCRDSRISQKVWLKYLKHHPN